jgi:hypothetical protein
MKQNERTVKALLRDLIVLRNLACSASGLQWNACKIYGMLMFAMGLFF